MLFERYSMALQYESLISVNNSLRHEKQEMRRVQNGF